MAAYRADIEIGVVGAAKLKELQDRITRLSRAIDDANVKKFIDHNAVQSLAEYSGAAGKAAANLRETAIQLNAAGKASGDYANAISQLVTAVGQENSALKIQNDLIKEEIELRRRAKLAASGIRETTQYAGPIGPGPASPVALSSRVEGRIRRTLQERQGRQELTAILQDQFEAERQLANSQLDEKAARVQAELDKQAAAAAESAAQVDKLSARQADFTARTDAAAQAAARQTSAFYRQLRIAKEVAKINAAAGPAQLLLAPSAPGAPAMSGGARRRITGQVERLGGARTADEAAATLRLAQATDTLAQSTNKIDPQYNRFLPDAATLNATGRGIQRLTTDQQAFNEQLARGIRFNEKYTQELERRRRLGIDTPASNRMPGTSGRTGGPFPMAGPIPLSQYGQTRRTAASSALGATLRQRAGGALGNAAVGGAFPLLFGQGAGAATGGAIGGLIGGAFGGVGGFAGSLIGTVIGDIAAKGDKVRQLAEDIGFSAEQTKLLEQSFKQAGREFDNFEASVQAIRGVGLAINDQASAIQAASQLAETYGGKIDKITNAFAAALSSGKVTQATLNQLTKQGIPIQEKLAATYGVSRSQLLAMAKDGEISVQQLSDAFVSLANETLTGATAIPSAYETASKQIQQSVNELVTRVSTAFNAQTNNMTTAFDNAVSRIGAAVSQLINRFTPLIETIANLVAGFINLGTQAASALLAIPGYVNNVVNAVVLMIPGLSSTLYLLERIQQITGGGKGAKTAADYGRYAPGFMQQALPKPISRITAPSQAATAGTGAGGKKGPKPPENRTAQLMDDLRAMELISITQDGIRDALFEGNKALAIRLEYDQQVADITRDTQKALRNANYESEKSVINAQQIVRLKDAELERDDKLRELTRDINDAIADTFKELPTAFTGKEEAFRAIFDQRIPETIKETKDRINELTDPVNQIIGAATAIGDAFADSFKGVVSGSMTAQQALASFFQNVANYFIDMAAQIAAEAIKLQGIKLLTSLVGSLFSGGVGVAGSGMNLPGLEGAGALTPGIFSGKTIPDYFGGTVSNLSLSPQITPGGVFAEGGFVTGPTRALIGEGGQPEYVIPASKMRSAMGRYAAGARGNSVLSPGMSDSTGTQDAMPSSSIDVRYTVERINSVDYVTADQFRAGMQQAAAQGAARGEQATLRRLQGSPSTRRKLGL